VEPAVFFSGRPIGLAAYERVRAILDELGPYETRTTKSQVAFRRRRGFAYLWVPQMYLGPRGAPVVLSIALARHVASDRWKEVAHPSALMWMHHLEFRDPAEIDDCVRDWLAEAYREAGPVPDEAS
jgi:hypothetical protein